MAHALTFNGRLMLSSASGALLTDATSTDPLPPGPLNVPLTLTNFSTFSATSPMIEMAQPFAKGDVPAGTRAVVYTPGGVPVSACQTDGEVYYSDGSLRLAVLSFTADGTFAAASGSTYDQHVFSIRTASGAPSHSGGATPAQLAAHSNIYLKIYGGDFEAQLTSTNPAVDWFEVNVNHVLATFSDYMAGSIGTNPAGMWTTLRASPKVTKWDVIAYATRHSDGAVHQYIKPRLHVTALSATGPGTGPYLVEFVGLEPNTAGPFAGGTIPGSLPGYLTTGQQDRHAGIYECRDRANGDALIGAAGGPNDPRWVGNTTIPNANFDVTHGRIIIPTALGAPNDAFWTGSPPNPTPTAITGGIGVMFTSTGTLPAGLSPAPQVYFPVVPHFGASDPPDHTVYLAAERYLNSGGIFLGPAIDQSAMTHWLTGTNYAAGRTYVESNGVLYMTRAGGVSGSTAPTGTGTNISDGGVTDWQSISVPFTDQGTGTITMIPAAMTFANSKILGVGSDCRAFWYDPVAGTARPNIGVGHDFTYLFQKSGATPHYSQNDAVPFARNPSVTHNYIPNAALVGIGTPWNVLQQFGDGSIDNRYGGFVGDQLHSFYKFDDPNSHQEMLIHACQWFDQPHTFHDETTGYPIISNLGPDRAGGTYPNLPSGSTKSTVKFYTVNGTGIADRPKVNRADGAWRWDNYVGIANSSHIPNPGFPAFLKTGREIFREDMLELWCTQIASTAPAYRNQVNPFGNGKTYAGIASVPSADTQLRAAAFCLKNLTQVNQVMPPGHPLRPFITDCFADTAAWLGDFTPWYAATYPKGYGLGTWDYPPAGSQGSDLAPWMLGHQVLFTSHPASQDDAPPGFAAWLNGVPINFYKWFDSDYGGSEGYSDLYHVETDSTAAAGSSNTVRTEANTYPNWLALANGANNAPVAAGFGLLLGATPYAPIPEGGTAPQQTNPSVKSFANPLNQQPYCQNSWSGLPSGSGGPDPTYYTTVHIAALAQWSKVPGAPADALKLCLRLDARRRNPLYFPSRAAKNSFLTTPGPLYSVSDGSVNGCGSFQFNIQP